MADERNVVLVCGGRDYDDQKRVFHELDMLHAKKPITRLIEGGARGADSLALDWRKAHHMDGFTYRAKWTEYGPGAGAIRNKLMLEHGKPDLVVAFPGGPGTTDMIKKARKAGVPVIEPCKEPPCP